MADEKKILDRLQRQCSKAEYCSSDIFRKALKALDGDREAAARTLTSLLGDRYVDDRRYASAFAREKSSLQGWGAVKIRFQLRSKGIGEDDIAAALSDIDRDKASSKLMRLLAEKDRSLGSDPQRKLKLLKFALGRGYSYDEVAEAVEKTMNPDK